jgi:hypothetical protein
MDTFTLEEAQHWIGQTIIAKTDVEIDGTQIAAEQQGMVIGIHGESNVQGTPNLCLAVQFWPGTQGTMPRVIFVTKRVFHEYLCLSNTVESLSEES